MEDLRQKLKILMQRKEQSEFLSESEKVKWAKSIKKLNDEILEVRTALYNDVHKQTFLFEKFEDLLVSAVKQAALKAMKFGLNYDEDFKKFLQENPAKNQELTVLANEVEYAFRIMDSAKAIQAIRNYAKKVEFVVKAFLEFKSTGFMLFSDIELEQLSIEDLFQSEGE